MLALAVQMYLSFLCIHFELVSLLGFFSTKKSLGSEAYQLKCIFAVNPAEVWWVADSCTDSEKDGTSYLFYPQEKTDFWCCQRFGEGGGFQLTFLGKQRLGDFCCLFIFSVIIYFLSIGQFQANLIVLETQSQ